MDVRVELEEVAVKLTLLVVEQLVRFAPELVDDRLEGLHETFHALDAVAREIGELLDGGEHVLQLLDAPAEQVELAEDGRLIKVELLALGLREQLVARRVVVLLVELVELEAQVQPLEELRDVLVPHLDRRVGAHQVLLAVPDHLVRDLAEERRHAL